MHLNYFQKKQRCGKVECRTCQEKGGHGPYWYVSQTIGGRTIEKYVGKHLPNETIQTIGRTDQSPFVGRQEELAHALQFLDHIETLRHPKSATRWKTPSRVQTLFLTGEVGIGKTRLAEEIAREAALRIWPIIWISVAQENTAPYQMWSEMLRATLAQGLWKRLGVLRHPERYQPLRFLLPDVLDLWPEEMRPSEQLHLWEAMRMLFSTICEKTTVLMVFDDMQWADSKSCELLAYLARHVRGTRILFLCTYCQSQLTNGPLHALLTDLQQEHAVEVLPMTPLGDEQIQELISHVPATLVERITKHIQGNPLFAEELARSSLTGDLTDVAHPTRPRELPETIAAVLALRLAHISPPCQRLLECGAVLGDAFPFTAIFAIGSEILQVDEDQFLDLLEEAMQAGTLIEEGGGNTISYHFWHPLLRAHLYNHLSAARRASLHRKAAHLLQSLTDSRKTEYAAHIIHHLVQSGATSDQIAHYTELAAHHAYSLSAYPDAAHWYQQVLGYVDDVVNTGSQEEHKARTLELLAECTRIQGKAAVARAYYEQALSIHQILHSPVEMQVLLWAEIGLCWFDENNLEQARQCYCNGEQVLCEHGVQGGPAWARLLYEQGYLLRREGNHQEALLRAREALTLFEQCDRLELPPHTTRLQRTLAGDPINLGRAHTLIGLLAIVTGHTEEALTHWLAARTIYERHHDYRELAIVYCNLGDLYLRRADYEQAKTVLECALDLGEKMGYASLISFTTGNLGVAAFRLGDWSRATDRIALALQGAGQRNDTLSMSFWSSFAGQIAVAQGQIDAARTHLVHALVYARQCHSEPYLAIALVAVATFHIATLSQTKSANANIAIRCKTHRILARTLALSGIEAETRIEAQVLVARLFVLEGNRKAAQDQAQTALHEAQECGIQWIIPLLKEMISDR